MATLSSIEGKLEAAAIDIAQALKAYSVKTMQEQINNYYDEVPQSSLKRYQRTGSFKDNALKSKDIGETTCLIYFVPQSYISQGLDSDTILDWNLHGRHGGYYGGADVWGTGKNNIEEQYGNIAAGVLKKHGIPFKRK